MCWTAFCPIMCFLIDMGVLARNADEVVAAVSQVPGARGFRAQQISGLPMLEVAVRPGEIARYGINSADVMQVVEAIAGLETTQIIEGQKRFDLVVKLSESAQRDKEAIGNLLVTAPAGARPSEIPCRHSGTRRAGRNQPPRRFKDDQRGGKCPRT